MAKGFKTGGRKPGTPNKVTAEVRETLRVVSEKLAPDLEQWFRDVAADDKAKAIDLYLKAIEYTTPKLSRIERTIIDSTDEELLAEVARRKAEAEKAGQ